MERFTASALTHLLVVADAQASRDWYVGPTADLRGARTPAEPVDHGHEVRAFFRDPDGHLFEISSLT